MDKIKQIASQYGVYIVIAVIVAVVAYQTALITQLKAQIALNERITANEALDNTQSAYIAKIIGFINNAQKNAQASQTGDANPSNPFTRPTSTEPAI